MAARWTSPRPFAELLPWAKKLEYYGLGGFGWGLAWLVEDRVASYRFVGRMSDDPRVHTELREVRSTHFLIHFRRPNKLSTAQLADTQPFRDAADTFAFCHNGTFAREPEFRPRYESRLHGKADSEVGFRMLEDLLAEGREPGDALSDLYASLGGRANIGFLSAGGELLVFNAYPQNRMWRFRSGDTELATTELHSPDESLFTLVFREAAHRREVKGVVAVTVAPGR